MPSLKKLRIRVNGEEYPSPTMYDDMYLYVEGAYETYLDTFKPDDPIPIEDWVHRYCKFRFDYRGHAALYSIDSSPAYKAISQGVDTSISHVQITTELSHALVTGDLKLVAYNWVPVDILIDEKLMAT